MEVGATYIFQKDAGKHFSAEGTDCPGRAFLAKEVGVGAVYTNLVECTLCSQRIRAWEQGLLSASQLR